MHTMLWLLFGYLIGSIPTGAWLAKLVGVHDITQHGSGNIGATNAGRVLGKQYFFLVLLLDASKAYFFITFAKKFLHSYDLITFAALAVLLGNSCSVFLMGKGGKGVATALGVFIALESIIVNWAFLIWSLLFFITRNVGISSVGAVASVPFFAWYNDSSYVGLLYIMAVWIIMRHESNIRRYVQSPAVVEVE